jgi:hypothetical protein
MKHWLGHSARGWGRVAIAQVEKILCLLLLTAFGRS